MTRLPISTPPARRPADREDPREVGRRGVARARAALAESRRQVRLQQEEQRSRREAELLAGRARRPGTPDRPTRDGRRSTRAA